MVFSRFCWTVKYWIDPYLICCSMCLWQNSAASAPPCPSNTAKYMILSIIWDSWYRSSFSFRWPISEAQPTLERLTLGMGFPYRMLDGSKIGSSMRLSQIPNESQVVGRPLLSGSKRELLDRMDDGLCRDRLGSSWWAPVRPRATLQQTRDPPSVAYRVRRATDIVHK